jgi:hypothetical protein
LDKPVAGGSPASSANTGPPLPGALSRALALLAGLADVPAWLRLSAEPAACVALPPDFLGVNVAPAGDLDTETWILDALRRLGLRQVRMDFSYDSADGPAQRLLERLLDDGADVMLDLFPPAGEARLLADDAAARQRWREFLIRVFNQYGGRVRRFEIGTTPNRGSWSGFNSRTIMAAWHIVAELDLDPALELAGPNVSDFEPLYNSVYLRQLHSMGCVPAVHTDNLFVERVVEPEAFDHRVLGRLFTRLLRLNLIKKARALAWIGESAGCRELVCTYTGWTSKRLDRRSAGANRKQVDYSLRYIALAAASGALRQVYWGPLVCRRDGLVDDGSDDYPAVDQVTWYRQVRGVASEYAEKPLFSALSLAARLFPGARLRCLLHQVEGASLFALERPQGECWLLAWCRDGRCVPLTQLVHERHLEGAGFHDGTGLSIARPVVVSEHPLVIRLTAGVLPEAPAEVRLRDGVVHLASAGHQSVDRCGEGWVGAAMLRDAHQREDLDRAALLDPEQLSQLPETRVMRDVRNRLWNVADPRGLCGQVTVKLNRVAGIKRLTYRFRPSKGRRHWNNACKMLRHGVATPLPLAYYEAPDRPGVAESWYLCEFIPDAFSSREVYAAFRDGAESFRGLDKDAWLELLAGFVCFIHNRQVVHRDLSSGNLLLTQSDDGSVKPWLIDIGRARVWTGPGSRVRPRHRLQDLIRIAYKLNWDDRERFIHYYHRHFGGDLGRFWRLPFRYYDAKQRLKKRLKGNRGKRTGRRQTADT